MITPPGVGSEEQKAPDDGKKSGYSQRAHSAEQLAQQQFGHAEQRRDRSGDEDGGAACNVEEMPNRGLPYGLQWFRSSAGSVAPQSRPWETSGDEWVWLSIILL